MNAYVIGVKVKFRQKLRISEQDSRRRATCALYSAMSVVMTNIDLHQRRKPRRRSELREGKRVEQRREPVQFEDTLSCLTLISGDDQELEGPAEKGIGGSLHSPRHRAAAPWHARTRTSTSSSARSVSQCLACMLASALKYARSWWAAPSPSSPPLPVTCAALLGALPLWAEPSYIHLLPAVLAAHVDRYIVLNAWRKSDSARLCPLAGLGPALRHSRIKLPSGEELLMGRASNKRTLSSAYLEAGTDRQRPYVTHGRASRCGWWADASGAVYLILIPEQGDVCLRVVDACSGKLLAARRTSGLERNYINEVPFGVVGADWSSMRWLACGDHLYSLPLLKECVAIPALRDDPDFEINLWCTVTVDGDEVFAAISEDNGSMRGWSMRTGRRLYDRTFSDGDVELIGHLLVVQDDVIDLRDGTMLPPPRTLSLHHPLLDAMGPQVWTADYGELTCVRDGAPIVVRWSEHRPSAVVRNFNGRSIAVLQAGSPLYPSLFHVAIRATGEPSACLVQSDAVFYTTVSDSRLQAYVVYLDDPSLTSHLLLDREGRSHEFIPAIGCDSTAPPMLRISTQLFWVPRPGVPASLACAQSVTL